MLEIQGSNCFLYTIYRPRQGDLDARMNLLARLPRMPVNLVDGDAYSLYCLFSPNMEKFIDFDLKCKAYVIRDTITNAIVYTISNQFLSLPKKEQDIITQVKFIAWEDNETLRLIDINADPFIEELIKINDAPLTEEVDSMTIPYLYLRDYWVKDNKDQVALGGNFFKDRIPMKREEVEQRLMRKHQALKAIWYLGSNRCEQEVKEKNKDRFTKIYNELFTVDYTSDPNNCILELPFTFYDWRRIETIEKTLHPMNLRGRKPLETDLKELTPNKVRSLSLNLLPRCETCMHKASGNYDFAKFITDKA